MPAWNSPVWKATTAEHHSDWWFYGRRRDGLLVLPYIGYIDEMAVGKPFLLPQEDPCIYGTLTRSFNCRVDHAR